MLQQQKPNLAGDAIEPLVTVLGTKRLALLYEGIF